MSKIEYIGKSILIKNEKENVLVIGDLHLGYEEGTNYASGLIGSSLFKEMMSDFDDIFSRVGEVDKLVFLGDMKHGFSRSEKGERYDFVNLLDYLKSKSKEIIVIKGNHDNYLINILKGKEISIFDFYCFGQFCFLHGDKDFADIHKKERTCWILGHLHPALKLRDGIKIEKYKCFLVGKYKGKEIIVMPSFIESGEGIDIRERDTNLVWDFDLENFSVKVVGEKLSVLDFGKLNEIE